MQDLISRQAAIDALHMHLMYRMGTDSNKKRLDDWINSLPSAQPEEEKISDTLYNIYRNTSPHTSAEGVAAVKYYIREIYREVFGEEGPGWMKK